MRFEIRAIGKVRGALADMQADYVQRLGGLCLLKEYEPPKGLSGAALGKKCAEFLLQDLPVCPLIVLDERGTDEPSPAFAKRLAGWQELGGATFLIGGADGHAPAVRQRAEHLLALGQKTWPHLLARVLLLEQIYRARQILAGHPYHRV
jgi:23S rRNA (pseudouridine1915-N3)-methyltransferase